MRYSWVIDSHTGMVRADNEDTFFPESDDASDGPVLIAVAVGLAVMGLVSTPSIWIHIVAELLGGAAAAMVFKAINPYDK